MYLGGKFVIFCLINFLFGIEYKIKFKKNNQSILDFPKSFKKTLFIADKLLFHDFHDKFSNKTHFIPIYIKVRILHMNNICQNIDINTTNK